MRLHSFSVRLQESHVNLMCVYKKLFGSKQNTQEMECNRFYLFIFLSQII